jgi:hypothetical protein
MKTLLVKTLLGLLALLTMSESVLNGQVASIKSYAGVNTPLTEANFPTRGGNASYNTFNVENTAVSSVNSVRFSAVVDVPDANVQVVAVSFSVIKVVNGAPPVTQLSNVSMGLSKWNQSSGTPKIYPRDADGNLIMSVLTTPATVNFAGPTVSAVRKIFITDQIITLGTASFPKLVAVGDYYELRRSITLNVTLGTTTTPITLTSSAFVRVVDRTAAPITGIASTYLPENVSTFDSFYLDGTFGSIVSGLVNTDYNRGWYVEGSSDLQNWVPVNVTVDAALDGILFSASPGVPKYFFRVVCLDPWATTP